MVAWEYMQTVDDMMAQAHPTMQAIVRRLRLLIAEIYPGVTEVVWGLQRIVGYGVGPKKMSEQFCYIAPQKNYVNLGFYYGADLEDPMNLLEGTGKQLRHVKIRSINEVENPALRALVQQASTHLPRLKRLPIKS